MSYRDRYRSSRPVPTRRVERIVTVFCDDTATAPAYFNKVLAKNANGVSLRVEPARCFGASADEMFESARSRKSQSPEDGDTAWMLIDQDTNPTVETRRNELKSLGVELVVSNPCFEVWILHHLEDTGAAFDSCQRVIDRVKNLWKKTFDESFPAKKAQADYSKLLPHIRTAVLCAKKRNERNSQSWTEAWRIAEEIIGVE